MAKEYRQFFFHNYFYLANGWYPSRKFHNIDNTQLTEQTKPMRILHTMLRVGNLQRSIDFYTRILGMRVLRQKDYPEGKFTNTFLGFGDETKQAALELTHNWETNQYDIGTGFGHIAIEVDDVYQAIDKIKTLNGKIIREAGPMNAGQTIIAFVEDPDGYQIELLNKKAA